MTDTRAKFMEAAFFLALMWKHQDLPLARDFFFSAFLAAARSVMDVAGREYLGRMRQAPKEGAGDDALETKIARFKRWRKCTLARLKEVPPKAEGPLFCERNATVHDRAAQVAAVVNLRIEAEITVSRVLHRPAYPGEDLLSNCVWLLHELSNAVETCERDFGLATATRKCYSRP